MFWREVLRDASRIRARAVIVATADRKNDWFENQHGDNGLTETIRRRVAKPRPVPMPHPLLVREAFDRGAGALNLIDPMYCGVLLELAGDQYLDFASAALDTQLPQLTGKPAAARSWAARFGQAARLVGSPVRPADLGKEGGEDGLDAEREANDFNLLDLNIEYLKATAELSKEAANFFHGFTTGNIARRTQLLNEIDWESLESWNSSDLIGLGRMVLRSAEVGDPPAINFISDLRDQAPLLPVLVREPIYMGCLAALYFDDEMNRRNATGAPIALCVLDLVALPEVERAVAAVGEALASLSPLFLPGSKAASLPIHVTTESSADNKSPADLLAIRLGDVDLMTMLQTEESLRFTTLIKEGLPSRDVKVGALLDVVARYHLLPRQLIDCNLNSDLIVRVAEYAGVELDV